MVRKLMTAALILTLGLALTACGNETAGTAANRWTGTNAASQEWAIQRQSDARGPLEDRGNGAYHADETGRVDGKLTYGSADSDTKGTWDAWVEYINSDKGALLGGATNSWRDDSVLDNVKSWGVGIDYTLAKNVVLTAAQTFGTKAKHGTDDPDEFTDVEINFLF